MTLRAPRDAGGYSILSSYSRTATPTYVNHAFTVQVYHHLSSLEEEGRGVHKVLVGKPEGEGPLGRPRRRWEDNIKMDLREVGRGCGDWMGLAQDRDMWLTLVSTVMNFRVP